MSNFEAGRVMAIVGMPSVLCDNPQMRLGYAYEHERACGKHSTADEILRNFG